MSADLPRALRCLAFVLERAGTPLIVALRAIADDAPSASLRAALEAAADSLATGDALAEALDLPGLPPSAKQALAAGEASGELVAALRFAAQLVAWRASPPDDASRALFSLRDASRTGLPLRAALDPDDFSSPPAREQARAWLAAARSSADDLFTRAPRLFPSPWGEVLDRAAAAGGLEDALDELTAQLTASRVWLTGPGGSRANELARVLRFLAWAVRHGLRYPTALGLAATLSDPPLTGALEDAAGRGSLADALDASPSPFPGALTLTIRRAAENDGDLPRTFRALADGLDQGLFPLAY